MAKASRTTCPDRVASLLASLNEVPRTDDAASKLLARYSEASAYALANLDRFHALDFDTGHEETEKELKKVDSRYRSSDAIYREFYDKFNDYPVTIHEIGLTTAFVAEAELRKHILDRQTLIKALELREQFPGIPTKNILPRSGNTRDVFIRHEKALDRLLVCPICKNIVWMKRLKSKTCGQKTCVETKADIGRGKHRRLKNGSL